MHEWPVCCDLILYWYMKYVTVNAVVDCLFTLAPVLHSPILLEWSSAHAYKIFKIGVHKLERLRQARVAAVSHSFGRSKSSPLGIQSDVKKHAEAFSGFHRSCFDCLAGASTLPSNFLEGRAHMPWLLRNFAVQNSMKLWRCCVIALDLRDGISISFAMKPGMVSGCNVFVLL